MNNNPFQLFDIAADYRIDESAINDKYLALQKQFHPDNFATRTAKEKLMATQISANVVAAHKTLLDPIARASALLNLNDFAFDLSNYISRDKMLLIEQMELREQLDSATPDAYPTLQQQWQAAFADLEEQFVAALDSQSFDNAAEIVLKMRYYQKLLSELHDKQRG